MRRRISIRGRVRPSVGPQVHRSVGPSRVIFGGENYAYQAHLVRCIWPCLNVFFSGRLFFTFHFQSNAEDKPVKLQSWATTQIEDFFMFFLTIVQCSEFTANFFGGMVRSAQSHLKRREDRMRVIFHIMASLTNFQDFLICFLKNSDEKFVFPFSEKLTLILKSIKAIHHMMPEQYQQKHFSQCQARHLH